MTTVIGDEDTGWVSVTTMSEAQRKLIQDIHLKSTSKRNLSEQYAESMAGHLHKDKQSNTTTVQYSPTAASPKALDSSHKVPVNLCPASAIIAIALVIAQGHKKPGRAIYNWRDPNQKISYMAYMGAVQRHLLKSQDGEDMDEELSKLAGVPIRHDWAAMSGLAIIEDARQCGTLVDDRPIKGGAADFLKKVTILP